MCFTTVWLGDGIIRYISRRRRWPLAGVFSGGRLCFGPAPSGMYGRLARQLSSSGAGDVRYLYQPPRSPPEAAKARQSERATPGRGQSRACGVGPCSSRTVFTTQDRGPPRGRGQGESHVARPAADRVSCRRRGGIPPADGDQ